MGTIMNCAAIVAGGLLGLLFGRLMKQNIQDALMKACGVCILFIGIASALEEMLYVKDGAITSGGSMLMIVCLALGTLIGEAVGIERGFERFGQWLKIKTGNAKDKAFVNGFVTASLTVCIGAMAIVGSLEDGLTGDYAILAVKAALDFIIILVMTCGMGKGCMFSAIPVAVLQGGITLLAGLVKPLMTELALSNLSLIGSILIFCVGVNLVWGKKLPVANMLPAVVLAVIAAFIPIFA